MNDEQAMTKKTKKGARLACASGIPLRHSGFVIRR
jgi:hypothetical protein